MASESDKFSGAKIAAGIVLKNKLIAYATNAKKSHPIQKKYGRNSNSIFLHAEVATIIRAMKVTPDLRKAELIVLRVKQRNSNKDSFESGMAKPCKGCMEAINEAGIKSIYYSLESHFFDMSEKLAINKLEKENNKWNLINIGIVRNGR